MAEVPDQGPTAIERAVARDEIHQLACRYADAMDRRDLDALVALFVPDVRVGPTTTGRDALRAFFAESLRPVRVSILFVGNHVIDLDAPDRAHGTVYCRALLQEGDRFVEQLIRYRDLYVRVGGEWLFVRRTHELWFGVETAERPLDQPLARWPERSTGTGTVPYADETWQRFTDPSGGAPGQPQ